MKPLVVSMPPSIIRNRVHGDLSVVERLAVQRAAQDVAEQVVAESLGAALLHVLVDLAEQLHARDPGLAPGRARGRARRYAPSRTQSMNRDSSKFSSRRISRAGSGVVSSPTRSHSPRSMKSSMASSAISMAAARNLLGRTRGELAQGDLAQLLGLRRIGLDRQDRQRQPLAGHADRGVGIEQVVVAGGFEHRRVVDQRPEAVVVLGMRDRTAGFAHFVGTAVGVLAELGRVVVEVDLGTLPSSGWVSVIGLPLAWASAGGFTASGSGLAIGRPMNRRALSPMKS